MLDLTDSSSPRVEYLDDWTASFSAEGLSANVTSTRPVKTVPGAPARHYMPLNCTGALLGALLAPLALALRLS